MKTYVRPKGTTIKDCYISSTLDLVGVCAQMSENLYEHSHLKYRACEVSNVLAGSSEHISLTQKEISNCAVEQLTSLCAGPPGPQPTHGDWLTDGRTDERPDILTESRGAMGT